MTSLEFAVLALSCALMLGAVARKNLLLCATADGDADMKIAPDHFSSSQRDYLSEAEAEALDYLRQKNSGNIDLARTLGEQFAALLIHEAQENFEPWPQGMANSLRAHHRLLLFSYVVNRVVAELSPDSILAHTTTSAFYSEVEQKAPQLDRYIRDMASYSLYILCERSASCSESEVGKIYARLCGDKDNARLIDEGGHYYRAYHQACSDLHKQTQYAQV